LLIIDAHLDLSWNALGWNCDLTKTVADIRGSEAGITGKGRGRGVVLFPEMRRGFWRMLRDWPSLERSCAEWRDTPLDAPFGFVFSLRTMPWIGLTMGMRIVGLAHYGPSAYAYGTGSSGGLTPRGRELLGIMRQLAVVLDLTHLADESFWEAAELFGGPILTSHNNCLSIIIERDGVIGAEQCPEDLDTIADLQKLGPLLHQRGYTDEDVQAMFYGNSMRFFASAWKA